MQTFTQKQVLALQQNLLAWYQKNARDLPWRNTGNPYHVWVSEIMLQQTRVEAVKAYFLRFIEALPTVADLANVSDDKLLKLWQDLGYYSRAKNLKKAAQEIVTTYGGKLPTTKQQWLTLPGVGDYTSGAVASIAFSERVPAVDGNVMRVFARLTLCSSDIAKPKIKQEFTNLVTSVLPKTQVGNFNQAIMDLGATVCLPNGAPLCDKCPLRDVCAAYQTNQQSNFPVKSKKPKRMEYEKTVFVVEIDGKVLLHKRHQTGLLANLWEFPNTVGHLGVNQLENALQPLGVTVKQIGVQKQAKHIFTHLEWQMVGYHIVASEVNLQTDQYVLASKQELHENYSVPSAFAAFLEIANREL